MGGGDKSKDVGRSHEANLHARLRVFGHVRVWGIGMWRGGVEWVMPQQRVREYGPAYKRSKCASACWEFQIRESFCMYCSSGDGSVWHVRDWRFVLSASRSCSESDRLS
jgi:hypothetical protein